MRIAERKDVVPTTVLEKRLLAVVKEQHELLLQEMNFQNQTVRRPGYTFLVTALSNAQEVMYYYE